MIPFTEKYCSCGDLREVEQIKECILKKYVKGIDCDYFIINLVNHGFIIGTNSLEQMKRFIEHPDTKFIYRNIGKEIPKI